MTAHDTCNLCWWSLHGDHGNETHSDRMATRLHKKNWSGLYVSDASPMDMRAIRTFLKSKPKQMQYRGKETGGLTRSNRDIGTQQEGAGRQIWLKSKTDMAELIALLKEQPVRTYLSYPRPHVFERLKPLLRDVNHLTYFWRDNRVFNDYGDPIVGLSYPEFPNRKLLEQMIEWLTPESEMITPTKPETETSKPYTPLVAVWHFQLM